MTTCHNAKCQDGVEEGELFCPACRLAIGIGLKYGAILAGIAGLVIGVVLEALR